MEFLTWFTIGSVVGLLGALTLLVFFDVEIYRGIDKMGDTPNREDERKLKEDQEIPGYTSPSGNVQIGQGVDRDWETSLSVTSGNYRAKTYIGRREAIEIVQHLTKLYSI